MIVLLGIILWLTSALFTTGVILAHSKGSWSILWPKAYREELAFGILFGLVFGPLGAILSFFLSGFMEYGWRLRP